MIAETAAQLAERRLLERVASGDQAAFADLYDRLSSPLFSLCLRMLGNAQSAEDALQESFMTLWRRSNAYDAARGTVFSWAAHLTRCKIIDHLRARGRRLPETVETARPETPAPAGVSAESKDLAVHVRKVLADLPDDQRRALELAYYGGFSHGEIAAQLGEPLGTVKARIRRGMLRLRDTLKEARP